MTLDKPTFVIIGAQKSGTTSLYHYLGQHPDVFVSTVKEPRFFSHLARQAAGLPTPNAGTITTFEAYLDLFAGATARAVGEASVSYLDVPGTAVQMHRYLPDATVIAVLRDPVERAYSQYYMNVRAGREHARFEDAVAQHRYLRGGFYYRNLVPFFRHYGADKIGVYLYDDLRDDPLALVQDVFRLLGLDDTFAPNLTMKHHAGGKPRSAFFHTLLTMRRVNRWIKRTAPAGLVRMGMALKRLNYSRVPMPEHVGAHLREIYRDDILNLQKLIRKDLRRWLDPDVHGT